MISIESLGLPELILDDWEAGIACESLDIAFPNVREVVTDRPGSHGTIDETRYFGARSVALKLNVFAGDYGSRRQILDKLAPFCDPGRRSTLRYEDPTGGGTRTLEVRAGDASAPLTNPTLTTMAVSWIAPSGTIESDAARILTIFPLSAAPGLTFPVTFPVTFPTYTAGPGAAVNLGSINAHWSAQIYGPFTSPALVNRNSEQGLYLPGLTVASGDYLYLDSETRTVNINGVESATRYGYLDFAASTWWTLGPGVTMVEFSADTYALPAQAVMTWHDAHLI